MQTPEPGASVRAKKSDRNEENIYGEEIVSS